MDGPRPKWAAGGPNAVILSGDRLLAVEVEGATDRLLVQQITHPTNPALWVWGWIPTMDGPMVADVLRTLFASNGSLQVPLMQSLPTSVWDANAVTKELFWLAAGSDQHP